MNTPQQNEHLTLAVSGMTCGSRKNKVECAVEGVAGVECARVDLATGRAHILGIADASALAQAVEAAGYRARLADPAGAERCA